MPNTVQILTLRRTTKYNCRLTVPSTYARAHGLQDGDRVLWLPQPDGVLLKFNAQGQVEPNLATSWAQTSPVTYVYHLRHGVKNIVATAPYTVTVTDTGDAAPVSSTGTPTQTLSRAAQQQLMISWQADDPDGDKLVYSLYFRGEDERDWKLLRANLSDNTYPLDSDALADGHKPACRGSVNRGSIRNGYANKAKSEPTFDKEYSRYGERPGNWRLNQLCTSGVVAESAK